nr:reverse transcriptase domain-containing protein [Tanacetum cinerariifolium]
MSTRLSARNLFPPLDNLELTIRRRSRTDPTLLNDFEMATEENGDPPVPDLRTMDELCQPSLNGRGGPIAPISIQATNFRLKNDMIQQVQNYANKHLDKFLHVTQSIKVNGVTDDALRLYLFPHSLTHHATAWFDRLPRNSINTFEQMAKMFFGKYFPPSMVTKLRNEITKFRQHLDESLFEVWERYKLSIDRCPNHNMLPITQIDTFYNGLTLRHRDTINAVAEVVRQLEMKNKNFQDMMKQIQSVKSVNPKCETCSSPHSYTECPAVDGYTQEVAYATTVPISEPDVAPKPNPKPSIPYPSRLNDQKLREKANNKMLKFFQIFQRLHFDISFADALLHMPKFASTFKSLLIGVAKDVFVKVRKFYFPVNFVVVDYDVEPRVHLILGRPFLRTAQALIDEYTQEVLGFLDSSTSENPSASDPIVASSFPSFTPFEGGDFILEEIETFLHTPNELDIIYLEKLLNEDPYPNLPPMKNEDFKQADVTVKKPSKKNHQNSNLRTYLIMCMMDIFHDMIEETMEVFMDDFLIFRDSFSSCLSNLDKILKMCEYTNLVLNWEKCHLMVKEDIVLGHKISKSGIEVDRAEVDVIAKLPHPTSVKGV